MQPFQFGDDGADVGGALGQLDAGDGLSRHAEGHGMGVGADAADALDQGDDLDPVAFLRQQLDAAIAEADLDGGGLDDLALALDLDLEGLFQGRVIGAGNS